MARYPETCKKDKKYRIILVFFFSKKMRSENKKASQINNSNLVLMCSCNAYDLNYICIKKWTAYL